LFTISPCDIISPVFLLQKSAVGSGIVERDVRNVLNILLVDSVLGSQYIANLDSVLDVFTWGVNDMTPQIMVVV
jgi:hypothetical protein